MCEDLHWKDNVLTLFYLDVPVAPGGPPDGPFGPVAPVDPGGPPGGPLFPVAPVLPINRS